MAENQAREDIPEIHDQVKTDYPADHPSARDDPLFKRSVGELKEMLHKREIQCDDCLDKEELIQRCRDNKITE